MLSDRLNKITIIIYFKTSLFKILFKKIDPQAIANEQEIS